MNNVYDTLTHSARQWPDHIAVFDEYGTLTYSELYEQTEKLKHSLVDNGVIKGTGIGIICSNSRYFIIFLYASIACEAIAMPISHQQKPNEILQALTEANLHFVLSEKREDAELGKNVLELNELPKEYFLSRTPRPLTELTASFIPNAAFIRFTSGTTGKAKGVIISHQSAIERVTGANEALQLTNKDRVVWVLPMAYHFVVSIVLYIKCGAGIIINNNFLAESIIESINKFKGTFLYAAPMHIKLLATYNKEAELRTLTKVISTTTGINPEICNDFQNKYNIPVSQAYGIIEIGLPIINLKRSEEFPEAVGYSVPSCEVAILDKNLHPLADEETGLLGIRGPGMFDGYLSPPTYRKDVLKNGWFMTGDYAVRKKDGLIIIKGREKNVINIAGNKVFPDEIETVINTYDGVRNSKAFAKIHPLLGEVVAVDVELENKEDFDPEALITFCRKKLSSFKIPQFVIVVDEIPLTGSGKTKRV
ncbi:MAG: acyl-CoA synthetase (AMP-forming)/AMP-acid ligase [Bacteroidetes bacterium]|jgi:acyl-CoA synthetase (AMP-forming)/AMP-acid ligase II|nr:acyl-CoA synthetase (AMP-forming)/AMP-acid ligase [Bacteroidota bacterium]